MNFDEINQILDMMREHDLVEFELERDDVKVRLKKQASGQVAVMPAAPVVAVPAAAPVASCDAVVASRALRSLKARSRSSNSSPAFRSSCTSASPSSSRVRPLRIR